MACYLQHSSCSLTSLCPLTPQDHSSGCNNLFLFIEPQTKAFPLSFLQTTHSPWDLEYTVFQLSWIWLYITFCFPVIQINQLFRVCSWNYRISGSCLTTCSIHLSICMKHVWIALCPNPHISLLNACSFNSGVYGHLNNFNGKWPVMYRALSSID